MTTEPASYWSAGQVRFLCPSCLKDAQIVARRKATVALGMIIALLIIVPGVIIASGLGRFLGYTLIALGAVTGTAGMLAIRQRNRDPKVTLGAFGVIAVSVAVIVAGMSLVESFALPPTASLHIINNSPASSINIFLDGKAVETNVPSAIKEDASSARWVRVPTGTHTIEARDASGKVLDSQAVELSHDEYLFAPAHNLKTCFILQIDGYGTEDHKTSSTLLDPERSFWKITGRVDSWFHANPAKVRVRGHGTLMSAVRQGACGNP